MRVLSKGVLLASGGMDSTTLAYYLAARKIPFVPLFVNYGQHSARTERKTLGRVLPSDLARRIRDIDVSEIYRGSPSRLIREANLWKDNMSGDPLYLPYRNLLLLSIGAAFAKANGYSRVYAAFINSNHATEIDCSAKFFDRLGGMLSDFGSVKVLMPFRNKSKLQVARLGISVRAPIAFTFSCLAKSTVPCGACSNCVERLSAFAALSRRGGI